MTSRVLEKTNIRRSFAAAANTYDAQASLQRQVGLALLAHFPPMPHAEWLLDVGSGTGFLGRQLLNHGVARVLALDMALSMLHCSRAKPMGERLTHLCADAEQLPLATGSVRQIYSNLALQWVEDLPALFAEFRRVLQPQSQLVFATFAPHTLQELKAAWAVVDDNTHVNEFTEPHELASALEQAGFSGIEMRRSLYPVFYPSVIHLMRELKGIGAHNVNQGRKRRPTTKQELQQMIANYPLDDAGQVIASYDVLFFRARVG